jgi:integrase-like protein
MRLILMSMNLAMRPLLVKGLCWQFTGQDDHPHRRNMPRSGGQECDCPAAIEPAVRQQIGSLGEHDGNSLLFTSPGGSPLPHTNFRIRVWLPALRAAGLPTIHFHDLRHTGNMFAADAGAGLRELMDRMGHSTTRAALTYLHGSDERQRAIAEALSRLTAAELKRRDRGRSGTYWARKRRNVS